ncbi:ER membrane protein complex subunit 2 [Entamoeba marina]
MEHLNDIEKQGDFDKIEEAINAILKNDSINKEAIQRLIALRISQGKYTTAINLLTKYTEVYYESQAYIQLAQLQCHIGEYEKAMSSVEQVLLLEPTNFYIWEFAGEIAMRCGDITTSRKMLLNSCKLSNYKYPRALKAALVVLKSSKDKKKECEALITPLEDKLKEITPEITKEQWLNQYL